MMQTSIFSLTILLMTVAVKESSNKTTGFSTEVSGLLTEDSKSSWKKEPATSDILSTSFSRDHEEHETKLVTKQDPIQTTTPTHAISKEIITETIDKDKKENSSNVNTDTDKNSSGNSPGKVAGTVIGILVCLTVLLVGLVLLYRLYRKRECNCHGYNKRMFRPGDLPIDSDTISYEVVIPTLLNIQDQESRQRSTANTNITQRELPSILPKVNESNHRENEDSYSLTSCKKCGKLNTVGHDCVRSGSDNGRNNNITCERCGLLDTTGHNCVNPDLLPFGGTSEEFHKLLSTGTYESFENRVFLCGSCACGKSTLASVLIGSPIPRKWKSTDGLVIYFGRNGINLGTYEMVPLKEEDTGKNVLTKVLIGKPNREQTSTCQSDDTNAKKHIEPLSTGTDDLTSNLQATKTDNDISSKTSKSSVAITRDSRKIPVKNTIKSEKKKVQMIGLPKMKKVEAYAVRDDILRDVKSGQYKIKIAPSDLVDFGGQQSYDMTHQLFVQHGGTFVVMFDGSKDFHEPLEEYPTGDISNESIVKHWVNSILTYCVDDSDIMPIILFAATHSDLLSEEMQKKMKIKFTKNITDMFGMHERKSHFIFDPVFFINGTDKEDKEITNLKNKLVSIARNQPSWGLRRPMIWVPLEILITNMKKDNINIILKTHLAEANKMNGDLALTDKQLDNFLLTQHALGKLMYFNQPELNNFVILHPPALVNILRSFITDEIFWPKDKILRMILRTMIDTGKICKKDLLKLWKQKKFRNQIPVDQFEEFVIQVLVHLDVLVLPKRYLNTSDAHVDYYLVPCTVKHKMPMTFLDDQSFANRTLSLVYRLQNSSIPSALSFKLIGAVSSIWPIMELDGRPLLYHSSAVLCVDGNTEFRLIVEDTKVIVYLSHKTSKSAISPDIAASIQECLTSTLEAVLKFYFTSIGKSNRKANVSNLLQIEVGEVCDRSPCVVPIAKAQLHFDWVCDSGNTHYSRCPLLWLFNKSQNECPPHCPGLADIILTKTPSEQQLARFANQLTNRSCRNVVLHLGLEQNDWEDMEDCYTGMPLIIRIMALQCWKTKRIKGKPTKSFGTLLDALTAVDDTRHLLCKVFREDTDLLDIADARLQEIPNDDVLNGLPGNLGNCAIQLGIELGIAVSSIKESLVRHHKDMYQQISDILRKWKSSRAVKPTIYRLMLALERVDTGGLDYLKGIYIEQ